MEDFVGEVCLAGWFRYRVIAALALAVPMMAMGRMAVAKKPVTRVAGKRLVVRGAVKGKLVKGTLVKGSLSRGSSAKGSVARKGAGLHRALLHKGTVRGTIAGRAAMTAQAVRLNSAFMASAQLRPMAQQLALSRSGEAYNGVLGYARVHPGDGAATAYLALGHAYMADRRYADAENTFRLAATGGDVLGDYADYLGAQAALQAGRGGDAFALLDRFGERHPGSIFTANAPVLLANSFLQQGNPQGALKVLTPLLDSDIAGHADFRYALARAYQLSGDVARAAPIYRSLYVAQPLTFEAGQASLQLQAMQVPLTAAERKAHADQMFNAKRYSEASVEYHAVAKNSADLSGADRDALAIYAAVCDLKLKHLNRREVERLPETSDDSAALKIYMLSELARDEKDNAGHDLMVARLVERYPASRWTEEALYSGGNMYLLKHDAVHAIYDYTELVKLFPTSTYAPSAHWRAAWMSYRLRKYGDAARMFDEQIERYGAGIEAPAALYWRGRIYEEEEHNFGQAVDYYRALSANYANYYYGVLARQRVMVLGVQPAAASAEALAGMKKTVVPELVGAVPENDPHVIKARLLANAALNEYIAPEIQASAGSGQWGALAQAEIYASYGEYTRALQSMKHSGISFFALPTDEVPVSYWHLLFPKPYWEALVEDAQRNGLDPYLVASLIRQESEFNAGAVSHANAVGLMQLLPSVGKSVAKKQGLKGFNANSLLVPAVNLQLGTANLKMVMDRFGGQPEYALAAYNAGDVPVRQWLGSNDYKDVAEFVESIPYTETREYVQAILRNREMYRALYPVK